MMAMERTWKYALRLGAGDDFPLAAALQKSRRWRHGEQNVIRCAENDVEWGMAA